MSGSTSATIDETPLVYPQAAMAFGAALLTLQLVARALRLLVPASRRRTRRRSRTSARDEVMTVAAAGAVLGVLALVLGAGVWVDLALYVSGLAGLAIFRDLPVEKLLAQLIWNATTTPELIALPALHPDGGDPVPLPPVGFALHRARAVDDAAAGAAAPR